MRVRVRVGVTPNLNSTGAAGLMRGASMRVLWIAPQGCVYYPVYEAVQSCRPRELRRELHGRLGRQVVIFTARVKTQPSPIQRHSNLVLTYPTEPSRNP